MYLFFLIFFIFISISLIFLILFQPGTSLNNENNFNTKSNIKFFNASGVGSLTKRIIGIFSCLFLLISIILSSMNSQSIDSDYFLEENTKNITKKEHFSDKKILNSDIPH